MINLIPTHARHYVKVEYWVRVISVWLLLFAVAFLIIASLLIPSLVLIRAQLAAYSGTYQTASEKNDVYQGLEKSVSTANGIASELVHIKSEALFSKLIVDLESVALDKVSIDSVSLSREDDAVESIRVSGGAISRAALVDFRDSLEAHSSFDSVNLPLSNLAKDKDVSFNVVIVISSEVYQ